MEPESVVVLHAGTVTDMPCVTSCLAGLFESERKRVGACLAADPHDRFQLFGRTDGCHRFCADCLEHGPEIAALFQAHEGHDAIALCYSRQADRMRSPDCLL